MRADTRRVLDGVRGIVHALRESSRLAERHAGVSGAQLFVLQKLEESSAASLNELAARTHTHQSSVSAVVTRLVQQGLVRRARSGRDGRSVELSLAAPGRRLVARSPDVAQERLIQAIQTLTPSRRRALATALGDLAKAMRATTRAPSMFFEDGRRRVKPRVTGG